MNNHYQKASVLDFHQRRWRKPCGFVANLGRFVSRNQDLGSVSASSYLRPSARVASTPSRTQRERLVFISLFLPSRLPIYQYLNHFNHFIIDYTQLREAFK